MNKAIATAGAMSAAAVLTEPSILEKTITYGAAMADTIIETTGNAVDTVMDLGNGATGQILSPLAALYGGVKGAEFIDDKILKLENKYGKFLFKTLGGITGIAHTPIAATIGTGIAAYKGVKWAGGGAIKGVKTLWNKGYSKSS